MSSSSKFVSFTNSSGFGIVLIDRPPANAYEIGFMKQLNESVEAANKDHCKAVIVRSTSEKFFCAGADIKVFGANPTDKNEEMVELARQALAKIESSGKIFIAEINGHALGGGLEIAMACDLRFAAEGKYLMGLPEIKLGLIPGNGGTQRLIRLIGSSKAFEFMLKGDSVTPDTAWELGLLNRLFPADTLRQSTEAFAAEIEKGPGKALEALKQCVNQGASMSLEEGLELEKKLASKLYDTGDAKEGFKAFLEKRPPEFE